MTADAQRIKDLEDEVERLKVALFWLTTDVEAWHRSWPQPVPPTKHEQRHLLIAKRLLGGFRIGDDE